MSLMRLALMCGGVGLGTVMLMPGATHGWARASTDPVAFRTEEMARGMNAIAGREIGPTTQLTGARAEGRMLVMQLRSSRASFGSLSDTDVSKMFTAMWCMRPDIAAIIGQGSTIRAEMTTADGHLTTATITTCAGSPSVPGA